MKNKLLSHGRILGLLAVIAFTTVSCEKAFIGEDLAPVQPKSADVEAVCGTQSFDLFAGQHTLAGTVTVANDDEFLYVTYETLGDVTIKEVHLFVTLDPLMNRVAPGQAPYKAAVFGNAYTFVIPFEELGVSCGTTIFLQAHAALSNGETAYGGTITKPKKGSWYGTIAYSIACCEDEPEEEVCQEETAFGGNTVGSGKAWWFYFDVNGDATQTIYAGQNIEVGTVTYVNGEFIIDLTGGWELQDVSESVKIQGYSVLPASRPAAGLFTTYKGNDLVVSVDPYPYYVIHLDVVKCEPAGGATDL